MPKIRGIKTETWTDDKFVRLSPLARLLFIGMWNYACDNGHVEDNAIQLKIRILPVDACEVSSLVDEMVETGQVERHEGYLKVIKLPEHQHIDMRWLSLCEWCEHDEHTTFTPAQKKPRKKGAPSAPVEQPKSTPRVLDADGDVEVDGEGEVIPAPAAKPSTRTARKRPATRLPDDWKPSEKHWERRHDGIDVQREAAKFRLHAEANDRRQANWNAAFAQWLLNARPTPGNVRQLPPQPDPQGRIPLGPLPARSPWGQA